MDKTEQRAIKHYNEMRQAHLEIAADSFALLPAWLQELESQRQTLETIVLFYQGLPYHASLFIPDGIRAVLNNYIKERHHAFDEKPAG